MVHNISQKSLLLKPYEEDEQAKKKKLGLFTPGKSHGLDDARDQEETRVYEEENQNKFVLYKRFGHHNENVMRVISVDEVPDAKEVWQVVIKVKASTISMNDCYIRRGIWHETIDLPATPGFDVVGTIVDLGAKAMAAGFDYGDAVAACCRTGGNARYIVLHYNDLTVVPGNVDSAQAVCVVSTYMTAYQALHRCKQTQGKHGTLEGSNILVTEGNSPIGQAVIELAQRAGVSKIFVTAKKIYHKMLHDQGVCPLPLDTNMWLPLFRGKMDLVIDGLCQDGYDSPHRALNSNGHLVTIGMSSVLDNAVQGICGTPFDSMVQKFKTSYLLSRTTRYCPYESSKHRHAEWKHDLEYLMELLARGKINPKVHSRVTLSDVAYIHQQLETEDVNGIVVCKPWK